LNYPAQLEAKAGFVRDALARVGKIDWSREIKVHHADEYGYRARAQVKLEAAERDSPSRYRVGFNRIGSHSICDVESCPILVPELDGALGKLRDIVNAPGADAASPDSSPFASLREIDIAAGDADIAVEPPLSNLPSGALQRTIGGMVYRFSPSTFFQANPLLLDALIAEAVGKKEGALAIDLYAGVGLFTLPLARRFHKVIGVESDKVAARFASENIAANKLANAEFYHARVEQWLASRIKFQRAKSKRGPDLLLLDPPRAGASAAIARIAELRPERIVYVSCDPTTLARDLRRLIDLRFKLERVTAIDLFPQTYHIETVAQLRRA
jgi:23S rRNA (uracil1939-C5)-methyltransferase